MSKDAQASTTTRPVEFALGILESIGQPEPPSACVIEGGVFVARATEPHFAYDLTRRTVDVLFAATLLLLFVPVFVVAAAINKRDGSVIYRQRRLGLYASRTPLTNIGLLTTAPQSLLRGEGGF
jgi:hypothetical protein